MFAKDVSVGDLEVSVKKKSSPSQRL